MATRIGILVGEHVPSTSFGDWVELWSNCFELALEEILARDALDQPVELVVRQVEGLPSGSQHNVVTAWRELEAEGVLAILGPSNADNGMSVRETANQRRIATFPFGCSEQLASPWTFSLNWGAAPEDSLLATSWLYQQGHVRVGLLWDTAWHGEEWMEYVRLGARRFDLEIVGDVRIAAMALGDEAAATQARHAREGLERLRRLQPDALLMMTSHGALPFVRALRELDWDIPRVVDGGSFGGGAGAFPELFEGWVGTTLVDESNPISTRLFARYQERFGDAPFNSSDMMIVVYDASRALLEGISLAPIMTRAGVREGIEKVKMLPAATGAPTSVISFSAHDHRGYQGPNLSVLRRQAGPKREDNVLEGYYVHPGQGPQR